MKDMIKKVVAVMMTVFMAVSGMSLSTVKSDSVQKHESHDSCMYIISLSSNAVVVADANDNYNLKANGDISMTENVSKMPENALFEMLECTDDRFPGYTALMLLENHNTVSAQDEGLRATGGNATAGWEVMKFEKQPDGSYVIVSTNQNAGMYVRVDAANDNRLKAGTNDLSQAERFEIVFPKGYVEPETTEKTVYAENSPLVYSDKKGVCSWYYVSENAAQKNIPILNKLGVAWTYNWGNLSGMAEEAAQNGIEYVPMIWGSDFVTDDQIQRLKDGKKEGTYKNLLTFNEPDLSDQSNMSVDLALELWPKLMETGLRLGSPAGAAVEDAWVEEFMTKAKAKGYRVDFLTVHVYQDFTHPGSVEALRLALRRLYNKYKIPIWITEIGNVDVETQWQGYKRPNPLSHELAVKYIREATALFESLDFVERYAWFVDYSSNIQGTEYTRLFNINDGSLTEEGIAYRGSGEKTSEAATTVAPTTNKTTQQQPTKPKNPTTTAAKKNPTTKKTKVKPPKRAVIRRLAKTKKKKLSITLKKDSKVKGFQIQISTSKKFKKKNTKNIYTKKIKYIYNKVKKKKRYYVRARAYVLNKKKRVYGKKWSIVKSIYIK